MSKIKRNDEESLLKLLFVFSLAHTEPKSLRVSLERAYSSEKGKTKPGSFCPNGSVFLSLESLRWLLPPSLPVDTKRI